MHLGEQRKLESNWEKARVRVEMMLMYGTNNLFNREEMIHMNAINRVEMICMNARDRVEMVHMNATIRVEMIRLNATNRVEMIHMNATNRVERGNPWLRRRQGTLTRVSRRHVTATPNVFLNCISQVYFRNCIS